MCLVVSQFSQPVVAIPATTPTTSFPGVAYLNPDSGRFWTMDSYVGDEFSPASFHKYLYVADNSVNLTDPSGLSWEGLDLFVSLPGIHIELHLDWSKRVIVYVRANTDHAWIYVENLTTGEKHTYGRWAQGYPLNAPVQARSSGVNTDMELGRTYAASRGVKVKKFKPTINAGYNAYNNNCATYAQSEWSRASGEYLAKSSILYATFDHPAVLTESILDENGGKKEVVK